MDTKFSLQGCPCITYTPGKWQRAKIVKHTPLLFGSNYADAWHKDCIGDIIEVREPGWQSAYYEVHTDDSILKADVELLTS